MDPDYRDHKVAPQVQTRAAVIRDISPHQTTLTWAVNIDRGLGLREGGQLGNDRGRLRDDQGW